MLFVGIILWKLQSQWFGESTVTSQSSFKIYLSSRIIECCLPQIIKPSRGDDGRGFFKPDKNVPWPEAE